MGRPAREEEVANAIGVTTERYRQMLLETNATVLSLDAPLNSLSQEDEVASLGELLVDHSVPGPVEQAEQQELTDTLSRAVDNLPAREKLLLSLYYQEELTMKEISKILTVSESRVCQLHMQAVMRLRAVLAVYRNQDAHEVEAKANSSIRVKKEGEKKVRHYHENEQKEGILSEQNHSNIVARSDHRAKRQIS